MIIRVNITVHHCFLHTKKRRMKKIDSFIQHAKKKLYNIFPIYFSFAFPTRLEPLAVISFRKHERNVSL